MKKKKKKTTPPNRTLKRPQRLQKAAVWLTTVSYTGRQLVHAYARKYHADLLASIAELRMLGMEISADYEAAIRRSVADRIAQKQHKIEERNLNTAVESDEHFAYIVGYTSGGAPYGLRWEELPAGDRGQE